MNQAIFNLHDLVLIFTMTSCMLMAIKTGLSKLGGQRNRILALFFICIGLEALALLILWNPRIQGLADQISPLLTLLFFAPKYLKGPALYCYVCSFNDQKTLKNTALKHLIPATLISISIPFFYGVADMKAPTSSSFSFIQTLENLAEITPFIYAVCATLILRRSKNQLTCYYASPDEIHAFMPQLIVYSFALYWAWRLAGRLMASSFSGVLPWSVIHSMGLMTNYLGLILYVGLYEYTTTKGYQRFLSTMHKSAITGPEESQRPSRPSLPPNQHIAAIEAGITEQQLHLHSDLNLEKFANAIGLESKYVTTALKTHFSTNFFNFINAKRTTAAKHLLTANPEFNILGIMERSGFNSKASFYRVFKQNTGLTPSEFRKKSFEQTH